MARIVCFCVCALALASTAYGAAWTYANPDRDWPSVNVECAGQSQSPINIVDNQTIPTTAFLRQYQSRLASFDLKAHNNGHSVEIVLDSRELYLSSSLFHDLMQAVAVHWHGPSEHRISGKQFAAEMHVVYQPIDRAFWGGNRPPLVVMGYLMDTIYDTGADLQWQKRHNDSLLNELLKHKDDLSIIGKEVFVKFVPRLPFFTDFYVYEGSLTTPPCSETVMWWLATEAIKVPKSQLDEFVQLLKIEHGGEGDARPTQPLNGRSVRRVHINAAQPVTSTSIGLGGQTQPDSTSGGNGASCDRGTAGTAGTTTMNFFFGNNAATTTGAAQLAGH